MVGTASLVALWLLSAAPPGVAVSTDRPDGAVVSVAFRETTVQEEQNRTRTAPAPPPQRLPPDPAYDSEQASSANKEGIPGPAPAAFQGVGASQAGRLQRRVARRTAAGPGQTSLSESPPSTDQPPVPSSEPARLREDAGETTCTDEAVREPCGRVYDRCIAAEPLARLARRHLCGRLARSGRHDQHAQPAQSHQRAGDLQRPLERLSTQSDLPPAGARRGPGGRRAGTSAAGSICSTAPTRSTPQPAGWR